MNVHEATVKNGLKIPWEYLFTDDNSGFEFAKRTACPHPQAPRTIADLASSEEIQSLHLAEGCNTARTGNRTAKLKVSQFTRYS